MRARGWRGVFGLSREFAYIGRGGVAVLKLGKLSKVTYSVKILYSVWAKALRLMLAGHGTTSAMLSGMSSRCRLVLARCFKRRLKHEEVYNA